MVHFVYVVGTGSRWRNNELRYSLRSVAANFKADYDVTVIGHAPPWLTNVCHMPAQDISRDPIANTTWKICSSAQKLPDSFVLMNDDFFIMKPVDVIPVARGEPMAAQLKKWGPRRGPYIDTYRASYLALLESGIKNPVAFDRHIPFPMEREKLECLPAAWTSGKMRLKSMYGNVFYFTVGLYSRDVKTNIWSGGPFWSTPTNLLDYAKHTLIRRFPKRSPYET